MVRWYHLIITGYGFWLPNDPRGSWSEFVGSWELYKFGEATKTNEKRSLAHDPHDVALRRAAKTALKYPVVRFDADQRIAIATGFSAAVAESDYRIFACCIGHDHAHLVVERHPRTIEQVARHLKSRATMALTMAGIHPLGTHRKRSGAIPTPWSIGVWSVFVNSESQLRTAVGYVQKHPAKERLAEQDWHFVRPLRG